MAPKKPQEHPEFPKRAAPARMSVWKIYITQGNKKGSRRVYPPGDPWVISREYISDTWGPGEYELRPHGPDNRLAGGSVMLEIADESGDVPRHETSETSPVGEMVGQFAVNPMLALPFINSMLGHFQRSEDRLEAFVRGELGTFAVLQDKIIASTENLFTRFEARVEGVVVELRGIATRLDAIGTKLEASSSGGGDKAVMDLVNALRKDVSDREKDLREALKVSSSSSDLKDLFQIAVPMWEKKLQNEEKRLDLMKTANELAAGRTTDDGGVPLDTVVDNGKPIKIPTAEAIKKLIATEGGIVPDGLKLLRALHAKKLLPDAHRAALGSLLDG